MNTPIADFLAQYRDSGISRLHMPGHKGVLPSPFDSVAPYDITEIQGADELYEAESIIARAEENTAALYGSGQACFSASGSTLCIQAMLAAVCRPGDTVITGRNAHSAFLNGCTLLDLHPVWITPRYRDEFGVSGELTPDAFADALRKHPEARAAYVTSPDYLGTISDIAALAALCREAGIPLLVDNAHGAHLRFLPENLHPISLGASLCCDSWHKTLPVLTGGACLHANREFSISKDRLKASMSLFGTTSPSYLILLSMDLCNRYLDRFAKDDFSRLSLETAKLRKIACESGLDVLSDPRDCVKLTFDGYPIGWTGWDLADWLRTQKIECEYAAGRNVVLLFSPQNRPKDFQRVAKALLSIPTGNSRRDTEVPFELPKTLLSPREAAFAKKEYLPIDQVQNRIAGETKIKCPPGVPIVVAGEEVGMSQQKLLKKSGISGLYVIK